MMGLQYENLDEQTRPHMQEELYADQTASKLYISERLNQNGVNNWFPLLKEAILFYNDLWLAIEIKNRGLLNPYEHRNNKKNGTQRVKISRIAHETLAEGEFNRFYIRGLCLRAIQNNIPHVEVYRARHSNPPRPESEALIGTLYDPIILLNRLRDSIGVDTALGLSKPNSGLSVRLP